MTPGDRAVAAARGAIGTRFRLQGRDGDGLDCVGLAALALRAAGYRGAVPNDYALRGGDADAVAARLDAMLARGSMAAGDVLLVRAGPGQLHLAVATGAGVIHADAGLRRVVERPGVPPWPVLGIWRVRAD